MYYENRGGKIHYKEIGEGIPILMIHGLGCHMGLMENCMEPLFNGNFIKDYNDEMNGINSSFKRIYVDLPGQGKSELSMELANSDGLLDVMTDFARQVIREDFVMVGESYGGYLSRGIMTKMMDKVMGLGLICPVGVPDRTKRELPEMNMRIIDCNFAEKMMAKNRREMSEFMETAAVVNEKTYDRYRRDIRDAASTIQRNFIRKLLKNYLMSFEPDEIIADEKFMKPAVFIMGRQDIVTGYRDFMNMYECYPRATMLILDGGGHQLQRENIPMFETAMKNWLGSIAVNAEINNLGIDKDKK